MSPNKLTDIFLRDLLVIIEVEDPARGRSKRPGALGRVVWLSALADFLDALKSSLNSPRTSPDSFSGPHNDRSRE
jgi:hypothetical protein